MGADHLGLRGAAALLGVEPATVTSYRSRALRPPFPAPDGHFDGRRDAPWWHRATILAWTARRPGRGAGGGRPRTT